MKTDARRACDDCFKMSNTDVSRFQMSFDDRLGPEDQARSNSDHGVVRLGAIALKPYHDEPLAISRLRPIMAEVVNGRAENDNLDSIPIATLESGYEIR